MRTKKIRGIKRRLKNIEIWREHNLRFDLVNYLKFIDNRHYTKMYISPWGNLSITNSKYPNPKGKAKLAMLSALLDIYNNWKEQLEKLEEPYYLKIWLFEPRFIKSQIVCAIGDYLKYYNNAFNKSEKEGSLNFAKSYSLSSKLEILNWECHNDEDYLETSELEQYEIERLLKKGSSDKNINLDNGYIRIIRGKVWIGG